jgi:hypothetical protein
MDATIEDRLAIMEVVETWASARDSGDWEAFRACWHDDGYMMATWFQGPATPPPTMWTVRIWQPLTCSASHTACRIATAMLSRTSVRQPSIDLGAAAAELLIDEVERPDEHHHRQVRFDPVLVPRIDQRGRRVGRRGCRLTRRTAGRPGRRLSAGCFS